MVTSSKILVRFCYGTDLPILGYQPAEGEVFEVEEYDSDIQQFLKPSGSSGIIYLKKHPPGKRLFIHQPTGRHFASMRDLQRHSCRVLRNVLPSGAASPVGTPVWRERCNSCFALPHR